MSCGVGYCLFTNIGSILKIFDSMFRVCKGKVKDLKIERLPQIQEFLNIIFHYQMIIGLMALEDSPDVAKWVALGSLAPTIPQAAIFIWLLKIYKDRNQKEDKDIIPICSIVIDFYIYISQWVSWAVIFDLLQIKFIQSQFVLQILMICLITTLTAPFILLYVSCVVIRLPCCGSHDDMTKKKWSSFFLIHMFALSATGLGLVTFSFDKIMEKQRDVVNGTNYRNLGTTCIVIMLVFCWVYPVCVVRFKKLGGEKDWGWINKLLQIYLQNKELRKKRMGYVLNRKSQNKIELLREKRSIYRIGENFYTEKPRHKDLKEIEKKRTVELCHICFQRDATCIMKPCNHGGVCLECTKVLLVKKETEKKCPFCRQHVHSVVEYKQLDYDGNHLVDKYAKLNEFKP